MDEATGVQTVVRVSIGCYGKKCVDDFLIRLNANEKFYRAIFAPGRIIIPRYSTYLPTSSSSPAKNRTGSSSHVQTRSYSTASTSRACCAWERSVRTISVSFSRPFT